MHVTYQQPLSDISGGLSEVHIIIHCGIVSPIGWLQQGGIG